jgi:hypothetical protein
MTKIAGSGSEPISQRHGSEDPDPDPPQNVMDPQHWCPDGVCLVTPYHEMMKWLSSKAFLYFGYRQHSRVKRKFAVHLEIKLGISYLFHNQIRSTK